MASYLRLLEIPEEVVVLSDRSPRGVLVYSLAAPWSGPSTLDLADRPELRIGSETVELRHGQISTVSRKEILLALLQHGRLTELKGPDCSVEVLSRHVALRQAIVAWAEKLRWGWPKGGPSVWNASYWNKGTPKSGVSLSEAIDDAFANQRTYKIGCYTATKLVMIKGTLDFYTRARDLPDMDTWICSRLMADGEPLQDVEPANAWRFESGFDSRAASKPGKIARLVRQVAPRNFVPGDWVYFVNTDPGSSKEVGYEGSSSLYLGGGRFSDYYGENDNAFSYQQKLDEVFQWRHGVIDLKRDAGKRRPLTAQDLERLGASPSRGGLVMSWRITPALFGTAIRRSAAVVAKDPSLRMPNQAPPQDREQPLSIESAPPRSTRVD